MRLHLLWAAALACAAVGCRDAAQTAGAAPQVQTTAVAKPVEVPNLWTRKQGVDWSVFLGPSGDSKSPETGIIKAWPAGGLKLVWHKALGTSYGAPTISRGRLFQFD